MTRDMLAGLRPATDDHPIRTVVNTRANGDHWFGDELVTGAEIIASCETAEEIAGNGPGLILGLLDQEGPAGTSPGTSSRRSTSSRSRRRPPSTCEGELTLDLGGTEVRVINLGPAHIRSDSVVLVPEQRTLFTGDLLFICGTPTSWAGPISKWIRACEFMLGCGADIVVPGHGPVTGQDGIRGVLDCLRWIEPKPPSATPAG